MTLPYIYDEILRDKVSDKELKRAANQAAFWELVRLKSLADKDMIDDFMEKDSIFSHYLRKKLKTNGKLRLIFRMPQEMVRLNYRAIRRLKLDA